MNASPMRAALAAYEATYGERSSTEALGLLHCIVEHLERLEQTLEQRPAISIPASKTRERVQVTLVPAGQDLAWSLIRIDGSPVQQATLRAAGGEMLAMCWSSGAYVICDDFGRQVPAGEMPPTEERERQAPRPTLAAAMAAAEESVIP